MEYVMNSEVKWEETEKRDLLRDMMMTACDISAIWKTCIIQKQISRLVADEFFQQADFEK